jgi:hypothetical protein
MSYPQQLRARALRAAPPSSVRWASSIRFLSLKMLFMVANMVTNRGPKFNWPNQSVYILNRSGLLTIGVCHNAGLTCIALGDILASGFSLRGHLYSSTILNLDTSLLMSLLLEYRCVHSSTIYREVSTRRTIRGPACKFLHTHF